MKVYDLTPLIEPELAVFPGDVGYTREVSMDFKRGQHLLLSAFRTTFHLGAHADSSSHYHAQGEGIDKRDLQSYCGCTQVIKVAVKRGERIGVAHLNDRPILAKRVLFWTGTFPNPRVWNSDFASLSPELIEYLDHQGVRLVGIDTPSVDPETSKGLESHHALYKTQMSVLEGIVLDGVPESLYTLVALPLPFKDSDASPVRALLFEKPDLFSEQAWSVVQTRSSW
jgi:arylformamidase